MIERVIQCLVEWTFNFNWQGQAPSFELFRESDVDKVLAERDKILHDSGLKFTKAYFMKAYGFSEDDIELDNGPAVSFAAPTKKLTSENYMPKEQSLHELAGDLIQPVINLIEQGQNGPLSANRYQKVGRGPESGLLHVQCRRKRQCQPMSLALT